MCTSYLQSDHCCLHSGFYTEGSFFLFLPPLALAYSSSMGSQSSSESSMPGKPNGAPLLKLPSRSWKQNASPRGISQLQKFIQYSNSPSSYYSGSQPNMLNNPVSALTQCGLQLGVSYVCEMLSCSSSVRTALRVLLVKMELSPKWSQMLSCLVVGFWDIITLVMASMAGSSTFQIRAAKELFFIKVGQQSGRATPLVPLAFYSAVRMLTLEIRSVSADSPLTTFLSLLRMSSVLSLYLCLISSSSLSLCSSRASWFSQSWQRATNALFLSPSTADILVINSFLSSSLVTYSCMPSKSLWSQSSTSSFEGTSTMAQAFPIVEELQKYNIPLTNQLQTAQEIINLMREQLQYQLYKRFQVLEKIGQGTYGVVFKVIDKRNGQVCALKKIFDAFQNRIDSQRTYREVLYLSEARHNNIVRLLDVIPGKNQQDVYLLIELMDFDLQKVLRMCQFSPIQRKFVIRQLLQALNYLHSCDIAHRDIKPANVLIDKNCNIKLCDFGLTRKMSNTPQVPLTDYIASRSYRPPEVILGKGNYGTAVDIWSAGCLLGELILGTPVFVAETSSGLLQRVLELVGVPKRSDLKNFYNESTQTQLVRLNRNKKTSFYDKFCSATDQEIDLLARLLEFTPEKRITAHDALRHPYFQELEPTKNDHNQLGIRVEDQNLQQTSCRKAIELISHRFRESEMSTISLSDPLAQKYVELTSSKISSVYKTEKVETSASKSKKLNKSKSTIVSDKNRSRITQSRASSSKRKGSKERKLVPKSKSPTISVFSKKPSSIIKPPPIKKKATNDGDNKKFYSQRILKDRLLQF